MSFPPKANGPGRGSFPPFPRTPIAGFNPGGRGNFHHRQNQDWQGPPTQQQRGGQAWPGSFSEQSHVPAPRGRSRERAPFPSDRPRASSAMIPKRSFSESKGRSKDVLNTRVTLNPKGEVNHLKQEDTEKILQYVDLHLIERTERPDFVHGSFVGEQSLEFAFANLEEFAQKGILAGEKTYRGSRYYVNAPNCGGAAMIGVLDGESCEWSFGSKAVDRTRVMVAPNLILVPSPSMLLCLESFASKTYSPNYKPCESSFEKLLYMAMVKAASCLYEIDPDDQQFWYIFKGGSMGSIHKLHHQCTETYRLGWSKYDKALNLLQSLTQYEGRIYAHDHVVNEAFDSMIAILRSISRGKEYMSNFLKSHEELEPIFCYDCYKKLDFEANQRFQCEHIAPYTATSSFCPHSRTIERKGGKKSRKERGRGGRGQSRVSEDHPPPNQHLRQGTPNPPPTVQRTPASQPAQKEFTPARARGKRGGGRGGGGGRDETSKWMARGKTPASRAVSNQSNSPPHPSTSSSSSSSSSSSQSLNANTQLTPPIPSPPILGAPLSLSSSSPPAPSPPAIADPESPQDQPNEQGVPKTSVWAGRNTEDLYGDIIPPEVDLEHFVNIGGQSFGTAKQFDREVFNHSVWEKGRIPVVAVDMKTTNWDDKMEFFKPSDPDPDSEGEIVEYPLPQPVYQLGHDGKLHLRVAEFNFDITEFEKEVLEAQKKSKQKANQCIGRTNIFIDALTVDGKIEKRLLNDLDVGDRVIREDSSAQLVKAKKIHLRDVVLCTKGRKFVALTESHWRCSIFNGDWEFQHIEEDYVIEYSFEGATGSINDAGAIFALENRTVSEKDLKIPSDLCEMEKERGIEMRNVPKTPIIFLFVMLLIFPGFCCTPTKDGLCYNTKQCVAWENVPTYSLPYGQDFSINFLTGSTVPPGYEVIVESCTQLKMAAITSRVSQIPNVTCILDPTYQMKFSTVLPTVTFSSIVGPFAPEEQGVVCTQLLSDPSTRDNDCSISNGMAHFKLHDSRAVCTFVRGQSDILSCNSFCEFSTIAPPGEEIVSGGLTTCSVVKNDGSVPCTVTGKILSQSEACKESKSIWSRYGTELFFGMDIFCSVIGFGDIIKIILRMTLACLALIACIKILKCMNESSKLCTVALSGASSVFGRLLYWGQRTKNFIFFRFPKNEKGRSLSRSMMRWGALFTVLQILSLIPTAVGVQIKKGEVSEMGMNKVLLKYAEKRADYQKATLTSAMMGNIVPGTIPQGCIYTEDVISSCLAPQGTHFNSNLSFCAWNSHTGVQCVTYTPFIFAKASRTPGSRLYAIIDVNNTISGERWTSNINKSAPDDVNKFPHRFIPELRGKGCIPGGFILENNSCFKDLESKRVVVVDTMLEESIDVYLDASSNGPMIRNERNFLNFHISLGPEWTPFFYTGVDGSKRISYHESRMSILLKAAYMLQTGEDPVTITLDGVTKTIPCGYEEDLFRISCLPIQRWGSLQSDVDILDECDITVEDIGMANHSKIIIKQLVHIKDVGTLIVRGAEEFEFDYVAMSGGTDLIGQYNYSIFFQNNYTLCNSMENITQPSFFSLSERECLSLCDKASDCVGANYFRNGTCMLFNHSCTFSLGGDDGHYYWRNRDISACEKQCLLRDECLGYDFTNGCSLYRGMTSDKRRSFWKKRGIAKNQGELYQFSDEKGFVPALMNGMIDHDLTLKNIFMSGGHRFQIDNVIQTEPDWIGNRSETHDDVECFVEDLCYATLGKESKCCEQQAFIICAADKYIASKCNMTDLSGCDPDKCTEGEPIQQIGGHPCELKGAAVILWWSLTALLHRAVCPLFYDSKEIIVPSIPLFSELYLMVEIAFGSLSEERTRGHILDGTLPRRFSAVTTASVALIICLVFSLATWASIWLTKIILYTLGKEFFEKVKKHSVKNMDDYIDLTEDVENKSQRKEIPFQDKRNAAIDAKKRAIIKKKPNGYMEGSRV